MPLTTVMWQFPIEAPVVLTICKKYLIYYILDKLKAVFL